MLSNKDDSSVEDTASSIGDSAWDLIDGGSTATSDDECHRLSRQETPMSDGHGEDLDRFDSPGAHLALDTGEENEPSTQGLNSRDDNITSHIRNAKQEEKTHQTKRWPATTSTQDDSLPASDDIWLKESAGDDSVFEGAGVNTTAYAILESFEGPRLQQLTSALTIGNDNKLIGTVRQSMANELCQPDRPYKVLYFGPNGQESPIMQKIGSALISRLPPYRKSNMAPKSTFSVVPVSAFGSHSSPEVVLVSSSGLQISVDRCVSARIGEHSGADALYVTLETGETLCSVGHGQYKITPSRYTLPDLGIIFLDERDVATTKLEQSYARSFMKSHRIPYILISSQKLWTKNSYYDAVDIRLPHLCIDNHSLSPDKPKVVARLPIDLASFVRLDAVQMSRSLAFVHLVEKNEEVVDIPKASERARDCYSRLREVSGKSEVQYCYKLTEKSLLLRPKLLFFIGAFLCSAFVYLALIRSANQLSTRTPMRMTTARTLPTRTTDIDNVKATFTSPATATSRTWERSLMSSLDLPSTVKQPDLTDIDRSEKFMAHFTGNCSIILQPPRWFNSLRKVPAINLSLSRGNESLKFGHTVLANGTYALLLEPNDHYGIIRVTFWSLQKPLINESITVELGNDWSTIFTRRKAIITSHAQESIKFSFSKLLRLLAPARLQARLLVQRVRSPKDLMRLDEEIRLSSLVSSPTSILRGWRDGVVELSNDFSGQFVPRWLTSKSRKERNVPKLLTLAHSTSAFPIQWVQSRLQSVRNLSMVNVAGHVRQYRESHLIESQKLAIRLWWNVRGGPSPRSTAVHSRCFECKPSTRSS